MNEPEEQIEEIEEAPLWKKIVIGIIGVFLILLTLSLTVLSGPVSGILEGVIESDKIENNVVISDEITLIFDDAPYNQLQSLYDKEQKVEFSVCLQGTINNDKYQVTSLYQPKMFEQTFNHVQFEKCSKESFAILHTHPYKSCIASDTDIKTLKSSQKENPAMLMIVMCDPQRVSVYR